MKKIPRPNYSEFPELYEKLDEMAKSIGKILIESRLFDPALHAVRFNEAQKDDIRELILKDPENMVPFFMMVCGFSDRELARLYGIENVYSLKKIKGRSSRKELQKLEAFVEAVLDQLKGTINLETLIYKFYKNWEEHQKRHYRAKTAEKIVIDFLRDKGYSAGKIKLKDIDREVDCSIPPDPNNPRVVVMIRKGVFKDLVKRAKEFSSEFDSVAESFPQTKFVVVYFVSPHEQDRMDEILSIIEGERRGKRPYDLIILKMEDLEILAKKLEEWGVPREKN